MDGAGRTVTIEDYEWTDGEHHDIIQFWGNLVDQSDDGDDKILTFTSEETGATHKLIVKGAASKQIEFRDGNGDPIDIGHKVDPENMSYNDDHTVLTISSAFSEDLEPWEYDSRVITIDASALVNDVAIWGNGNSNSIVAGSCGGYYLGNEGDDTLRSGSGDDAFNGGTDGADVLVYWNGAGNDTFENYECDKDIIDLLDVEYVCSRDAASDKVLIDIVGTDNRITLTGEGLASSDGSILIKDKDGVNQAILVSSLSVLE